MDLLEAQEIQLHKEILHQISQDIILVDIFPIRREALDPTLGQATLIHLATMLEHIRIQTETFPLTHTMRWFILLKATIRHPITMVTLTIMPIITPIELAHLFQI